MEKVSELKLCVDTVVLDTTRFFKKNNRAAGVRARKNLQKCKKLSQEIRLMIQKTKQEEFQKKAEGASARAAETGSDHLKRGPFVDDDSYITFPVTDDQGNLGITQPFIMENEEKHISVHRYPGENYKENDLNSNYDFNTFDIINNYPT